MTQWLDQLMFLKMTTQNASEDVKQQEFSFIASKGKNDTATLEDNLALSYKCRHNLIMRYSGHIPRYFPKWDKNE